MMAGKPEIIAGARNRWMIRGARLLPFWSMLADTTRRLNQGAGADDSHGSSGFESERISRHAAPAGAAARRRLILLAHGAGSNTDAPLLVHLARACRSSAISCSVTICHSAAAAAKALPFPAVAVHDRAANRRGSSRQMRKLAPDASSRAATPTAAGRPPWPRPNIPGSPTPCCCSPIRCIRRAKPAQKRTAYFPDWRAPALFVHGTARPVRLARRTARSHRR